MRVLLLLCLSLANASLFGVNHTAPNRYIQYDERSLQEAKNVQLSYPRLGTEKQPLRIKFVTNVLDERRGISEAMDQQIDYIVNEALPRAAEIWSKHLSVVPVSGGISIQPDACYGAYGSDRRSRTVNDADLVVIVSGETNLQTPSGSPIPVCEDSTLAVGAACELDQFDRPIVGFINFCLGLENLVDPRGGALVQNAYSAHLGTSFSDVGLTPDVEDVTVHEMGHLLGFSSWLFKYFRNPDGTPRTPRPFVPSLATCVDGSKTVAQFPSDNTLQEYVDPDGERSYMIVTPRVKQVARNHFDCQEMDGARLENMGDCMGSHWHERLFFGEVMSPAFFTGSQKEQHSLSALTLALMEDTGWYEVDYRGADIPRFGLGAGCDFVHGKCIVNDAVPSWGKGMFCDSPVRFDADGQVEASLENVGCDPDHLSWTICDLWDTSTVPSDFGAFAESRIQYFSDANLSPSFSLASFCPIPAKALGVDCTVEDDNYTPFYDIEARGSESRCLQTSYFTGFERKTRPACMRTRCDADLRKLVVGSGSGEAVCDHDGQVLRLKDDSSATFECPRLAAVCPEFFSCPGGCSGRGICMFDDGPRCECFDDEDEVLRGNGCYPNIPEEEKLDEIDTRVAGASSGTQLYYILSISLSILAMYAL